MKNNFRYTKLPNRNLPKFQQKDGEPGEVKYDQNGYPIMVNPNFQISSGSQDWQGYQGLNLKTKTNWDQRFQNWGQGFNRGLDAFSQGFDNTFDKIGSGVTNIIQGQPAPNVPCPDGQERGPDGMCRKAVVVGPDDSGDYLIEQGNNAAYNASPETQKANTDYGNQLIQQQGLFKFGKARDLRKFTKGYNQQYGTNYKAPTLTGTAIKSVAQTAKSIATNPTLRKGFNALGVGAFNTINAADAFLQHREDKRNTEKWRSDFMDSAFQVEGTQGLRGDHELNTDKFQQDINERPNKGMWAQEGGTINTDTMKIRITGLPEMAYGGQSKNYGLNLNQKRVQVSGKDNPYSTPKNTLTGVPREMANIEAEGNETILGDFRGKGKLEHMFIKGPSHANNGVPLDAPDKAMVFSQTKSMAIKDKDILAKFGLPDRKKGYTPAEIAKRYNLNKFLPEIENPLNRSAMPIDDPLSVKTAQMNYDNGLRKLQELALVQEAMKGFPGGIPDVSKSLMPQSDMPEAKFGGYLPEYQSDKAAGTVGGPGGPRKIKSREEFERLQKEENWKVDPKNPNRIFKDNIITKDKIPGQRDVVPPAEKQYEKQTTDPCAHVAAMARNGWTREEIAAGKHGTPGSWSAQINKCYEDNFKERGTPDKCPEGFEWDESLKKCVQKSTEDAYFEEEPKDRGGEEETTVTQGGGGYGFKMPQIPWKAPLPARLFTGVYPKKYPPIWIDEANVDRDYTLLNYDQMVQNRGAINKRALDTAATALGDGNNIAAVAANIAGQQAEGAANDIYKVEQTNVGIANNALKDIADNKVLQNLRRNQGRMNYNRDMAIMNQQYDNARRGFNRDLSEFLGNRYEQANTLGWMNYNSPYIAQDPDTGRPILKNPFPDIFSPAFGGSGQAGQGMSNDNMGEEFEKYYEKYYKQLKSGTDEQKAKRAEELAREAMRSNRVSQSTSYNQYGRPRNTTQRTNTYGNPPYMATPPYFPQGGYNYPYMYTPPYFPQYGNSGYNYEYTTPQTTTTTRRTWGDQEDDE